MHVMNFSDPFVGSQNIFICLRTTCSRVQIKIKVIYDVDSYPTRVRRTKIQIKNHYFLLKNSTITTNIV